MKFILAILLPFSLFSQAPSAYFQQEVNYTINVKLDDQQHMLSGNIEFQYINHSPDTLREIWVHLWGNAFKDRHSAFCHQKLRDGNTRYYFSKKTDRGYYSSLAFTADGSVASWKFDPKNPDIAVVSLPQPLLPGAQTRLSTPFQLKVPASFSRLGHVGESYQMTQWYPKPAVYDHKGWHAMPYLDMGEFYSEFGSFDVTISLPENYVVGATGSLQTPSEVAFLHEKAEASRQKLSKGLELKNDAFPASSTNFKTIRYTAERVHDFAWFADKRFYVWKDTAILASGKTVECWAMFTNAQSDIWQKGAFYVKRAVEFYSTHVGEYPWPQATAVHSALSAGGGMEYPMITVIGNSGSARELDDVITHEVGHNWFYGILASNERDHPFMDEGLNSYYEARYMKQYYGEYSPVALPKALYNPEKVGSLLENGCLLLARDRKDTPPDSHSAEFTQIGYGLQVYMKTAMCLYWLEQALGTEKFDAAMQDYFKKWQFRHPYPEDFKAVLEANGVSANWFFEAMQTQKQADYALKNVKPLADGKWELEVKEKGGLSSPFSVSAIKDGKATSTAWYWDFVTGDQPASTKKIVIKAPEADAFAIDPAHTMLDVNRKNNRRRTSGIFPGMEPWQVRSPAIFQHVKRNTIGVLPWLGWNNAGKTMLGLVFFNPPLPPRNMQVFLAPGYATGTKNLVGMGDIRYRFYPGGLVPKVIVSVGAKMFNLDYNPESDFYTRFYRIMPQIRAELRSASPAFRHALNFRTLFIGREAGSFDQSNQYTGNIWRRNVIHEIRYEGEQKRMVHPYRYQIALETQDTKTGAEPAIQYWRGTAEWRQQLFFKSRKKFTYRLFAGYFFDNSLRNQAVHETALSLNPQDFNDYKFDQLFAIRAPGSGILHRQVSQTQGGFKGAFGAAYADVLGNSNNFAFALNLKTDLPFRLPLRLPLKPYFDLGYFDDTTPAGASRPSGEQWLWNGGLALELFNGGLEVYFPLVSSKFLREQYCTQAGGDPNGGFFCGGNYFKTISWSMRINLGDPMGALMNLAQ